MTSKLNELSEFQQNTYSQNGEDGVIAEILHRISKQSNLDKWCVEFGAWDGVHLSNTCKLIREEGYSAILIEGDPKRVEQLKKNLPQENVIKICRFISFEGKNTLDDVLSDTPIPHDFDFLSIDIDGVDYHIFDSLKKYRPKIICIEFNPTIPNAVDFVQPKDFLIKQGSSAKAISRLAREKGYDLVSVVSCNLILVRNDLTKFVINTTPKLEDLNPQGNDPQYIFVGYDGTILSNKDAIDLAWHGLEVPLSKIQFLPKFLRICACDYSTLKKALLGCFLFPHFPKIVISHLTKKIQAKDRTLD
ncbi:MAG TPA: FkbM family methyltransferase [Gallionellaceae bacterium]